MVRDAALRFGFVHALWNHAPDPPELLERAVGEVGVDYLVVPVITGPRRQFRTWPALEPLSFATAGGWHYPPNLECYSVSAARPRPADWVGKRNALASVARYAAAHNLTLCYRIDLRFPAPLLQHHAHLWSRTAWGEPAEWLGACLNNTDLHQLLRGACDDLLRYAAGELELANWASDAPPDALCPRPCGWCPAARDVLDACFCSSCRQIGQRAQIDVDRLAHLVREEFPARLAVDPAVTPVPRFESTDALRAYHAARCAELNRFIRHLAESLSGRRLLIVRRIEPDSSASSPIDLIAQLSTAGPELDPPRPDELRARGAIGASLPPGRPLFSDPTQLVRYLRDAAAAGFERLEFEALEEFPPDAMTWLRQAVRYARRG
jgi:hypothetical protein